MADTTNAERQARFRDRNVVLLTSDAREIAAKLIDMADQAKLKQVARYINDHLKHRKQRRGEST